MVGSNILEILSLCGCPTKLLLQHGSFVCAVTSDTESFRSTYTVKVDITISQHHQQYIINESRDKPKPHVHGEIPVKYIPA